MALGYARLERASMPGGMRTDLVSVYARRFPLKRTFPRLVVVLSLFVFGASILLKMLEPSRSSTPRQMLARGPC